jgi:hypothetical protein
VFLADSEEVRKASLKVGDLEDFLSKNSDDSDGIAHFEALLSGKLKFIVLNLSTLFGIWSISEN